MKGTLYFSTTCLIDTACINGECMSIIYELKGVEYEKYQFNLVVVNIRM